MSLSGVVRVHARGGGRGSRRCGVVLLLSAFSHVSRTMKRDTEYRCHWEGWGTGEIHMRSRMRMSIGRAVDVTVAVAVSVPADRRVDLVHFRPSPSAQR